MPDTLLSKLEASRKELLDLGMGNSLLNFKQLKSKGVHIVDEKSSSLFKILVTESKTMTFLPRSAPDLQNQLFPRDLPTGPELQCQPNSQSFQDREAPSPTPSPHPPSDPTSPSSPQRLPTHEEQEALFNDNKLQTNETEKSLAYKLTNTFYAAKTSYEEQGVNILFLSLGMLHWYESDDSQEERLAPLVLIPVQLERSTVREKMKLTFSQEEIGENVSLHAKMKVEFGIDMPLLGEIDDFDITNYFRQISDAISSQSRWKVSPDYIELGFFSFNKFLIYTDLDNSKWPETKKPIEHPLLKSLFEEGFRDDVPGPSDDAFIDTDTNAAKFFQVIDADSSQILAMISSRGGKSLLIQGPPGTGKSQTITNLIADAVGQGKKVLFVAEKMAALDVVKRKLDAIGLGEICLELHSSKANKKEFYTELIRILALGRPNADNLEQDVNLLDKHKAELNDYCRAINTSIPKGRLTAHQLIGRLLRLDNICEGQSLPRLDKSVMDTWDADIFRRAEGFAERIQAQLQRNGTPSQLLFWGCGLSTLLPYERDQLLIFYKALSASITELQSVCNAITEHFNLPPISDRAAAADLLALCTLAARSPDLGRINIESSHWLNSQARIDLMLNHISRLNELHGQYREILLPVAWTENILESRRCIQTHGKKWYRFLIADYKRARNHLASICRTALPKAFDLRITYLEDILEAQQFKRTVDENTQLGKELFGSRWQGLQSDIPQLQTIARYQHDVHEAIAIRECPPVLLAYLNRHEEPSKAAQFERSLTFALQEHQQRVAKTLHALQYNESCRFPEGGLLQLPFPDQAHLTEQWIANAPDIHQAIAWNTLEEVARNENLQALTNLSISWEAACTLLTVALQKSWYEYLLDDSLRMTPALRQFQRDRHEEVIQQFRQLDKLNLQYNRARVAMKHWNGLPGIDAGGQVNVLKREFNKRARFKPIRQVVKEAGLALQAIKPVLMMSPLSIANFLPPGAVEFDLVIFDEASQVKPVEALGAVLRGRQIVVVGDNKQLPPTNFFDSLSEETDDEENVTAEIQSILGMCHAQGLSSRMLRWHYRSRHESLITLSNHEFYDDKLVVFPSPGSGHELGLRFRHLKDTVYDRGKTRTNPKEAQVVAEAVMLHARTHPHLSLGVVAFSSAQREAIDNALDLLQKNDPTTESFFSNRSQEPFFVKNLENVQGDERDVIFISIGYGRTQDGYVAMSFGPVNNEGGERRLNVLITRAKLRCEVFTNLNAADIDLTRTKRWGIVALKNFLHYAEFGKLNLTQESGRPADSFFEENVADKLTSLGYIVRKQLGSQGFYIDLAIVDPKNPGRYVIGIECDGATYHSARSARDRDRLRQEVLENNGWRIHRIWSTDWFRHPEQELKRTVQAIERAKELLAIDDQAQDADQPPITGPNANPDLRPDPANSTAFDREYCPKSGFTPPPYQISTLPTAEMYAEIHLYPLGRLSGYIRHIVQIEGPIHFDEMAHRITDAANVSKVGSRIREALLRATSYLQQERVIDVKGDFLWVKGQPTPVIRDRSKLPNGSRKLKYIAPEEILLAIQNVVREALAIEPTETAVLVVRLFGFTRMTEEMTAEIATLINRAVHDKIVHFDGGFLKPTD